MGQLLFILVAALLVGAIVFGVAVVITGGDPGLEPAEPDGQAVPLPITRPLVETDVGRARFDVALRGYRMAQVDQALARVAYDIGYKDELINVLEAEIAALRAGRVEDAEVLRRAREASLTQESGERAAVDRPQKSTADPAVDLGLLTPPARDVVDAPGEATPDVPAPGKPAAAAAVAEPAPAAAESVPAAKPAPAEPAPEESTLDEPVVDELVPDEPVPVLDEAVVEAPVLDEVVSEESAAEASPAAADEPPTEVPTAPGEAPAADEHEPGRVDPTTQVPLASGENLAGEQDTLARERQNLAGEQENLVGEQNLAGEQEQTGGGKPVRDREPAVVDDALSSRR